jgi:protoporphyrinogen oxidase
LIIGAGPAGLGAAWRLNELREGDWLLVEKNSRPGGLASSFTDGKGFVWDIGGHVLFSHYNYFDEAVNSWLGDNWVYHVRESWVWMDGRFIPYPFQNNIRHLSKDKMWECLAGVIELYKNKSENEPENFKEWARQSFGNGICKYFMEPYNFKVWGYLMEKLSYSWIGERVSVADLEKILQNIIYEKDDLSWGPNNLFQFPLYSGTGSIWQVLVGKLPENKIRYNVSLDFLNTVEKTVKLSDGEEIKYENLISTMPVDLLIKNSDVEELKDDAKNLKYSSTHVVGIGLEGKIPEKLKTKCWMYFPENDSPFYRVTVFSNYSPNNTPAGENWSLMCEVSESFDKSVNCEAIIEDVIKGLQNTKLIEERDKIVSKWHHFVKYGYPTPSLERDEILRNILPKLEEKNIYSRGRFGAWKYEVGNMDHSFMQGVECADRIVKGAEEITVWKPDAVNVKK